MNVKLAAQTMSTSVASTLKYTFQFSYEEFDSRLGDAIFDSFIARLLNMFNTRTPFGKRIQKYSKMEEFSRCETFLLTL